MPPNPAPNFRMPSESAIVSAAIRRPQDSGIRNPELMILSDPSGGIPCRRGVGVRNSRCAGPPPPNIRGRRLRSILSSYANSAKRASVWKILDYACARPRAAVLRLRPLRVSLLISLANSAKRASFFSLMSSNGKSETRSGFRDLFYSTRPASPAPRSALVIRSLNCDREKTNFAARREEIANGLDARNFRGFTCDGARRSVDLAARFQTARPGAARRQHFEGTPVFRAGGETVSGRRRFRNRQKRRRAQATSEKGL